MLTKHNARSDLSAVSVATGNRSRGSRCAMPATQRHAPHSPVASGGGQRAGLRIVLALCFFSASSTVCGQVFDSFDGGRPRMQLDGSDCSAAIVQHGIDIRNGRGGSPSERVVLSAANGTYAHLAYPIPPAAIIDELVPSLWVRATSAGCQLGVRVVFPQARPGGRSEPLRVVLRGNETAASGSWQPLSLSGLTRRLHTKVLALRRQYGAETDLSAPYVDAIILNGYTGSGVATVWVDDLSVEGHVPIDRLPRCPPAPEAAEQEGSAMPFSNAFPLDQVVRVIEYRGESFEWLASLGFDVVLLGRPRPQPSCAMPSGPI